MKTLSWSAGVALLGLVVCVSSASADTVKCQRSIAKASAAFIQAKIKALGKCAGGVVKSGTGSPKTLCPDTKATSSIAKAADKLAATINKSCGGNDKVCAGDLTGEDLPGTLGWPAQCPIGPTCNNPISTCADIITCLTCADESAVDQEVSLYYDRLALPSIVNPALNKCQIAIGKATSSFLATESKSLQKCWDGVISGKLPPATSCVPPAAGDGKYLNAIASASAKARASIGKACGGTDKAIGGGDDFTAAQIGFSSACPSVTDPGGGAMCAAAVSDLNGIATCVDCATKYKENCADELAVPQLVNPYPAVCVNGCTAAEASGPCPTSASFTADGPNVDLDTGFTGLGHNAHTPTNGRLTFNVIGCAGSNEPTCGQCNVTGPIDNAGGVPFDNHRCSLDSSVHCESAGDCSVCSGGANDHNPCTVASQCPGGACVNDAPCIYYFGAPLPLVAGGVSTCVVNQLTGSLSGTLNVEAGTSATNVPLASMVFPFGDEFHPCPNCVAGKCTAGTRTGADCTVQGTGVYGDISLDCPPPLGALAGTLSINLTITTGNQTRTVSTANPLCTQTGYTSLHCLCDTCNDSAQEACATNADCPISGGNPGICGGKRCIGGTNDGAPCVASSECAGGGLCDKPGQPTQPNSCLDDTTTPLDGHVCQDVGGNEGQCPEGPVVKSCSTNTTHVCDTDDDCNAPGCTDCIATTPPQTCVTKLRPCFTDSGIVGNSVNVAGNPDVPCDGVAHPQVGALFCVGPVSASAVNAAGGIPALGRVRIPGTVIVSP